MHVCAAGTPKCTASGLPALKAGPTPCTHTLCTLVPHAPCRPWIHSPHHSLNVCPLLPVSSSLPSLPLPGVPQHAAYSLSSSLGPCLRAATPPQIATKIEVFVAAPSPTDDPRQVPFKRLGYLSFDSNERSSHQVRVGLVHVACRYGQLLCPYLRGLLCPYLRGLLCPYLKGLLCPYLRGLLCPYLRGLLCPYLRGLRSWMDPQERSPSAPPVALFSHKGTPSPGACPGACRAAVCCLSLCLSRRRLLQACCLLHCHATRCTADATCIC